MKPKKFSINFIYRPEIFYEDFELELKIEGKNRKGYSKFNIFIGLV